MANNVNMTFKTNLLPNSDLGYSLGDSSHRWNIYGNITNTNVFQGYNRTQVGTSPNFDNPGINGLFEIRSSTETTGESGIKPFNSYGPFFSVKTPDNIAMLQLAGTSVNGWYIRGKQSANVTLSGVAWDRLVTNSGTWDISITGNANTATKLASTGTTGQFWRGDNTWSNTLTGGLTATTLAVTATYPNIRGNGTGVYFSIDGTWAANKGNVCIEANALRPSADSSGAGMTLGTSAQPWGTIYGNSFTGNAATATKISSTPNNTTTFLRGDNTWSNEITGILKASKLTLTNTDGTAHINFTRTGGGDTTPNYINIPTNSALAVSVGDASGTNIRMCVNNTAIHSWTNNIMDLGTSSIKWKNVYAYAFKGNADTATKLATARTISLTGSVTGSGSFDGNGDLSITTTTNHNHDSAYKKIQTTVSDPSANSTAIAFIDTISQNTQGVITATKKTVRDATFAQSGILSTGKQSIAGQKTIRYSTRIYPLVGTSQERSQWFKITFPYATAETTSSAKWFMNSFDLHFGGGYAANPAGSAHVIFYWTRAANNGAWSVQQAQCYMDGIYMNKINLYYRIAEPGILYVNNASNIYQGIWLDNLFVDDTAPSLDWSNITIETCADITDSTNPALSAYTVIPTTKVYTTDGTALKTNGNIEGQYIKGTWLYTSAATAKTTTAKIATIESDNYIYYITPANALKSAIGTSAIGAAGTPIYWNGSNFVAGTAAASSTHNHDSTYLKLSGGTLTGDLGFTTIGTWPVASGETYPISSKGITWSGSSDGAKIFYRIDSANNGNLIIQSSDDGDEKVIFRTTTAQGDFAAIDSHERTFRPITNNTGTLGTSSYKWNNIYATTFTGTLDGNAGSATKLSNTPNNTTTFLRGDNNWSNTLTGPLYINNATDAGKDQNGALVIGNKTGLNIGIDDNEIMARNNSATSTLYLNNEGGLVTVGSIFNSPAITINGATSAGTNYITGSAGRIFFGGNFHLDSLGSNKTYINHYTANDVVLCTGTSQGKVGIGTSSPSQKLHVSGGLLGITANGNTVTIGSQNNSYAHIQNSADIPFYFNKSIWVDGDLKPYGTTSTKIFGDSSHYWKEAYITTTHGALNGNAATASKLTNITTADAASSADVWRNVWISYSDNATGRPAYDADLAYQTSTDTLKSGKYQLKSKARIEYNDTTNAIDFIFI